MAAKRTARERIVQLAASFDEQDADLAGGDPLSFEGYGEQMADARRRTGETEAAIWGWAEIGGQLCALVAFDFAFLGGSLGTAVGEKVARAFDAAREAGQPVVCLTASGGARMQEGMWALVQMAKTVEGRRRHAEAGLAQITYLCSPTTGGVYASFASLADVILAEPNATVGFAGPRVVEELTGELPPPDTHTAEFALAHGLIDAIVPTEELAQSIARALRGLGRSGRKVRSRSAGGLGGAGREAPTDTASKGSRSAGGLGGAGREAPVSAPNTTTHRAAPRSMTPWESLLAVRDPSHPKGQALLGALLPQPTYLRRGRDGSPNDEHVLAATGVLAGTATQALVVAQNAVGDGRIRPGGFRKAIRAFETAGRLGLPLVTVIDTRGADPAPSSEAGGVAGAIARTFLAMLSCPTPTLAILTGEGGSGGALSMAVADRVLAWPGAVFSVIAPEGAAAILYRDAARAPELAARLRITTPDLMELGLVDALVDPHGDVGALVEAVGREITELSEAPDRLERRAARWRGTGG